MTTEAESQPFNAASFYALLKEGRFMGVRCRDNGNIYAEARPLDPVSTVATWSGMNSVAGPR